MTIACHLSLYFTFYKVSDATIVWEYGIHTIPVPLYPISLLKVATWAFILDRCRLMELTSDLVEYTETIPPEINDMIADVILPAIL